MSAKGHFVKEQPQTGGKPGEEGDDQAPRRER